MPETNGEDGITRREQNTMSGIDIIESLKVVQSCFEPYNVDTVDSTSNEICHIEINELSVRLMFNIFWLYSIRM